MKSTKPKSNRLTVPVTREVFRQVYNSPASVPGKHKWLTRDKFENLRSFKCHNWAYAREALLKVIQEMTKKFK